MTEIERQHVCDLVIRVSELRRAIHAQPPDWNDIAVWGRMALDSARALGISLNHLALSTVPDLIGTAEGIVGEAA